MTHYDLVLLFLSNWLFLAHIYNRHLIHRLEKRLTAIEEAK